MTRPLVIAHRGFSRAAPENTLPAFQGAVEAGADLVELDCRFTKDGVPVVIHDETLDRTTDVACARLGDARVPVAATTLAELRALDAGSWFHARFAGTRVPTLAEALDAIHPRASVVIERKTGAAAPLVALFEERGLLDEVIVASFDWAFLADGRTRAPTLRLCAVGEDELTAACLERCVELGVFGLAWRERTLQPADIEAAHERGLSVWAWTVNALPRARALIAAGIDGLITDDPATMVALVRGYSA